MSALENKVTASQNFVSLDSSAFLPSTVSNSNYLGRTLANLYDVSSSALTKIAQKIFTILSKIKENLSNKSSAFIAFRKLEDFNLTQPQLAGVEQKMIVIANKNIFMKHLTGLDHPESPMRVEAIETALVKAGLMDNSNTLKSRPATNAELLLCHDQAYIEEVERFTKFIYSTQDSESFYTYRNKNPAIPGDFQVSKDSYDVSLHAVGAPLTAIDYILNPINKTSKAFCIVRPPGHHAHHEIGSGFCVFNNVAVAAKYLAAKGLKTAIIDWDAHHGDGTQELVEQDRNIFYFSTHRDTSTGFYPGPNWGGADQKGRFNNVMNCPVSGSRLDCRLGIIESFHKLIPAMDDFKPDFILISCGFDAHEKDTLVGLGLKDEDYKLLTEVCVSLANKYSKGRIVSVLEGGYKLEAISQAAKVHVKALRRSA